MSSEINKLKKEVDGLIMDLRPERIEKIYCKKAYNSLKLLWLDNNLEAYEASQEELKKFTDKLLPSQTWAAMMGEINAYNRLLYTLRCRLRSEGCRYLSIMVSYNHILGMVQDYLETYEGTGDDYWYKKAKNLLRQVTGSFEKQFCTSKSLEDMNDYIERQYFLKDLTPDDRERLEFLKEFIKRQIIINRC